MGFRGGHRANLPEHGRSLTSASERPGKYGQLTGTAWRGSGTAGSLSSGNGRSTTWQSCPQSREREVRLQRVSLRTRPQAARRRRLEGPRELVAQPPDPGGLLTEKEWTGKQGRRESMRKLLGTGRPRASAHAPPTAGVPAGWGCVRSRKRERRHPESSLRVITLGRLVTI